MRELKLKSNSKVEIKRGIDGTQRKRGGGLEGQPQREN